MSKVYLYDHDQGSNATYAEEYSFIRKRTQISSKTGKQLGSSYQLTTVHITHDGKQIEMKRIITAREYNAAYKTRDEKRHIVTQKRIAFFWEMHSFNIHIFTEPVKDLCICHTQTSIDGDGCADITNVDVTPPFLNVERLIEDNKDDKEKFSTFNISLIKN